VKNHGIDEFSCPGDAPRFESSAALLDLSLDIATGGIAAE